MLNTEIFRGHPERLDEVLDDYDAVVGQLTSLRNKVDTIATALGLNYGIRSAEEVVAMILDKIDAPYTVERDTSVEGTPWTVRLHEKDTVPHVRFRLQFDADTYCAKLNAAARN